MPAQIITKDTGIALTVAFALTGAAFTIGIFVSDTRNADAQAARGWEAALAAKDARDQLKFQEIVGDLKAIARQIEASGADRFTRAEMEVWTLRLQLMNQGVIVVPDSDDPSTMLDGGQ
jgi:hypothetical protein